MFDIKNIRTLAMSVKDLGQAEKFYTEVLGGKIVKKIAPTEEERKNGRYPEVDVQLGNFQVHLFDGSRGPRPVDPHHTLTIPWQEKEISIKELQRCGAEIEKVRPHADGKSYSLNVLDPDGNRWELSFSA